jgi:hypothetical protein
VLGNPPSRVTHPGTRTKESDMPDENDQQKASEETLPDTPLHAHGSGREQGEDREEDMEGEIGGGQDEGAETAENTGGATSGGPGGEARGEDDPSDV